MFNLDEERRSNFCECFVLKAKARLRRSSRRKQKEALRLRESKSSLVHMTNHTPVIKIVKRLWRRELVTSHT